MKKLLVLRFSALGDVAMVVPVVKSLAAVYPDWDITMLSKKQYADLFNDLPENVHFFGADFKGKHRGLSGLNRLLHDLRYREFDAVADLHDVLRSLFLRHRCLWRGKRVAHIHKDRYQKWLLVRHFYQYKHPLQSTVSRYRNVLAELGFELSLSQLPIYQLTNSPTHQPRNIGIAPFAAHKGKIYPIVQMENVVRLLSEKLVTRGEKIFLFGAGKEETAILHEWEKKYPAVESLAGKYKMNEEIQIMAQLRLMITMDSANMHLASLVGTRVLSIWGATHPWAGFLGFGQSENDCIQLAIPCRPCSIYGNLPCRYGDYRCLHIDPQAIVERTLGAIIAQE